MKYVALLSGGKDSCYNLLHCAKNGHELVAAASLGPESGKEELDSYLYQTVGQDAIEFVARALDVPLYRRVIMGSAVEQGSEYGARNAKGGVQGDETEDLYELLLNVKSQHPNIEGVSVGAILSNYQRVRVEHVCRRLTLTPLCYLWQRDQGELLSEMIDGQLEAVLIKVAGIGLTTKHLGKTLAEMQPTLVKLNTLYGSHICGEGGEYESLTLDCPLFKHRIVLTEVETIIHSDNDFATVAFLRIKNAVLEPKTDITSNLQVAPLLEDRFIAVHDKVLSSQRDITPIARTSDQIESHVRSDCFDYASSKKVGSWVAVANVQRSITDPIAEVSLEDEVTQCFHILRDRLAEYDLQLSDCTNINIFLSSIDLFSRVNAVYATFFGTSPPARACVAIDLPHPISVRLDCTAFIERTNTDRQALHVQGLSYWAPANIGPYSQAITAEERVFISGQIGLIPSSLSLPLPKSLALETALAAQHVERVTDALRNNSGGGWTGHTQAAIYWLADTQNLSHIKKGHEGLPERLRSSDVPTLFLVVKDLPKNALVEKQVLVHTGRCSITDEDYDEVLLQPQEPIFERKRFDPPDGSALHWQVSRFDDTTSACAILCVRAKDGPIMDMLQAIQSFRPFKILTLSVRLFYVPSRTASLSAIWDAIYGHGNEVPTTPVPCRSISTMDIDDWDYVICILGT